MFSMLRGIKKLAIFHQKMNDGQICIPKFSLDNYLNRAFNNYSFNLPRINPFESHFSSNLLFFINFTFFPGTYNGSRRNRNGK